MSARPQHHAPNDRTRKVSRSTTAPSAAAFGSTAANLTASSNVLLAVTVDTATATESPGNNRTVRRRRSASRFLTDLAAGGGED